MIVKKRELALATGGATGTGNILHVSCCLLSISCNLVDKAIT